MLQTKYGSNWPCSFQKEDKNVQLLTEDARRWTKTNCGESHEWLKWPIKQNRTVLESELFIFIWKTMPCLYMYFKWRLFQMPMNKHHMKNISNKMSLFSKSMLKSVLFACFGLKILYGCTCNSLTIALWIDLFGWIWDVV